MPPPETQREITILHVDDEPEFIALTKAFLEREQEREQEKFVVNTESRPLARIILSLAAIT
jgi:CheY-like chemotaxis protein